MAPPALPVHPGLPDPPEPTGWRVGILTATESESLGKTSTATGFLIPLIAGEARFHESDVHAACLSLLKANAL